MVGFCPNGRATSPVNWCRVWEKDCLAQLKGSEMFPRLLHDRWLDIMKCKVGCKMCANGLVVAIASSQSGGSSSIPQGRKISLTLLLNWCSKPETGL